MYRRSILKSMVAAPFVLAARQTAAADVNIQRLRSTWRELLPDGIQVPAPTDSVSHSEEEWRQLLGERQFAVLREAATEPAFSSPLNEEKRPGVFLCAGCDLPLFTSQMKFDSGTGWPSFFTTIPDAFETELDFVLLLPRTEYHCARCGGHHGHVFDDGPPPTNERWCNNGVALRFVPAQSEA